MAPVEPGVAVVVVGDIRDPARQRLVWIKLPLARSVPEVLRRQVSGHPVWGPRTVAVGEREELLVHQEVVLLAGVQAGLAWVAHEQVHISRTGRQANEEQTPSTAIGHRNKLASPHHCRIVPLVYTSPLANRRHAGFRQG
jgi:hypothetical protein